MCLMIYAHDFVGYGFIMCPITKLETCAYVLYSDMTLCLLILDKKITENGVISGKTECVTRESRSLWLFEIANTH